MSAELWVLCNWELSDGEGGVGVNELKAPDDRREKTVRVLMLMITMYRGDLI